jgi:hypothetical protein
VLQGLQCDLVLGVHLFLFPLKSVCRYKSAGDFRYVFRGLYVQVCRWLQACLQVSLCWSLQVTSGMSSGVFMFKSAGAFRYVFKGPYVQVCRWLQACLKVSLCSSLQVTKYVFRYLYVQVWRWLQACLKVSLCSSLQVTSGMSSGVCMFKPAGDFRYLFRCLYVQVCRWLSMSAGVFIFSLQ